MERIGNPITGYSTEYYSAMIEMQKEINDSRLSEIIKEKECPDPKYNLPKEKQTKYNRMQKK